MEERLECERAFVCEEAAASMRDKSTRVKSRQASESHYRKCVLAEWIRDSTLYHFQAVRSGIDPNIAVGILLCFLWASNCLCGPVG